MTVHNAAEWLEECLRSVLAQTFTGRMELSLFNDASTVNHALLHVVNSAPPTTTFQDRSMAILEDLRTNFHERGVKIVTSSEDNLEPRGGMGIFFTPVAYKSYCSGVW